MEPSDQDFCRSYNFLTAEGVDIPLGASLGGVSTATASTRHTHRHVKSLSNASGLMFPPAPASVRSVRSRFSDNTLVQSVLLADGLVMMVGDYDEDNTEQGESMSLEQIPGRYTAGSVKAKLTWFGVLCLAGIGMFVEAYVIITTGQVKTVWHSNYPTCWDFSKDQVCPNSIACCGLFPNTPASVCTVETFNEACNPVTGEYTDSVTCADRQVGALSYAEFAGIMAGMVIFGFVADRIGRQRAGTLTAALMILGIGGMTFFSSQTVSTLFQVFAVFFGGFGLGVGGEYPLTASQASEYHAESAEDALMDDEERRHQRILMERSKTARRGETISLVFAMQGVGAVVGSVFLMALIQFSNQTRVDCDGVASNSRGVDPNAVESIWRSFYFIGLIFVCMLLGYRFLVLEEGEGYNMVVARRARREHRIGHKTLQKRRREAFKFYAPRLVGTGGNWFVWDIAFYGLKLFSGPIFDDINPGGSLIVQNGYLLVNNLCALAGYYCAAAVIDRPAIGRKRLQMCSFSICAVVFMITAAVFESAPSAVVMMLYFSSSFFGNFGVNVTTYVMAAETFPTELRGTFHGLSAFLGKLGALLATISFGYLSTADIFWACAAAAVVGLVFTYVFSVDLTGVSLAEHDAQLELLYAGKPKRYKGKLNDPKHLSKFELWTGRHGTYDPQWVQKLINDERTKESKRAIIRNQSSHLKEEGADSSTTGDLRDQVLKEDEVLMTESAPASCVVRGGDKTI